MKSKDILTLAVIGIVSMVISIIISNNFLATPEDRQQEVEVVEPISSVFERPPEEYFNEDSLNPTKTIEIKPDPDSKPFGGQ